MILSTPNKNILLLEENSEIINLISSKLRELNYQVTAFDKLSEFLESVSDYYLQEEKPFCDLIIIGESFNQEEKLGLLTLVRSNQDPTSILVINDNNLEANQNLYLESGANDVIGKPFTLNELLTHCQHLLSS